MWQHLIVALIVAAALLHVSTKYLPASLRKRIVGALVRRGASEAKLAVWFKIVPGCGDGCGSCVSCDSPAPAAPESPQDTPAAKRVIKLHVQR